MDVGTIFNISCLLLIKVYFSMYIMLQYTAYNVNKLITNCKPFYPIITFKGVLVSSPIKDMIPFKVYTIHQ